VRPEGDQKGRGFAIVEVLGEDAVAWRLSPGLGIGGWGEPAAQLLGRPALGEAPRSR